MPGLFETPETDLEDDVVLDDLRRIRADLQASLRVPRRWAGGLRRVSQARAIQGSNTIEGYTVSDQDAMAAVDDEKPLTADARTWLEILGYRRVLTYVLNVATEPGFRIDLATLNALHFMLLEHDLLKSPGRYRTTEIYVHSDRSGAAVYEGPKPDAVGELMVLLQAQLTGSPAVDPLVAAAMAHLNLVMIHPYRDGNGRMARALQTMVLAQRDVVEPTFSSIEEWLGANTDDYYRVLADVGGGRWQPERDAHAWVKFNLRAHHLQAQTVQRRFAEASDLYIRLDELVAAHRLPERVSDPLFDAALGRRVTRPSYLARLVEPLDDRSASRDLQRLVTLGLLEPHGQTRGRYYVAAGELAASQRALRSARAPLVDPYPNLMDGIRRRTTAESRPS